ncbi:MAG: hypothetical protein ACTTJH_07955 [Bacteroidales bacterium]
MDETITSMIQKLKAKGFYLQSKKDRLRGKFKGENLYFIVVTNKNKVYRIVIKGVISQDEGNIKIAFNKFCDQFSSKMKYVSMNFVGDFKLREH